MPTYENCYEILKNVRMGLNEYTSNMLNGTDTTGPHSNTYLVKQINNAQRYLYGILFQRIPEEFLEETTLTGVNSVYTLPWDFGRLLYFKNEAGRQVYPTSIKKLRLTNETGSDRLYYKKGNTLVLDKAGVTESYVLLYYKKPLDLEQGQAAAGAATSITLATSAKKIADYYNSQLIENITKDWVDTITDYSTARVATITETAAANDFYGTISNLPEMFHHLIAPKAIMLVKASSPVVQEKPSRQEISDWNEQLIETLRAFVGSDDSDPEELFLDYDQNQSAGYGYGYIG